jgi:hypothetical protein
MISVILILSQNKLVFITTKKKATIPPCSREGLGRAGHIRHRKWAQKQNAYKFTFY